jgi:hypothetical protein
MPLSGASGYFREETILSTLIAKMIALGRAIGPYVAIEILLPGGSLIALLFWLYRVKQRRAAPNANSMRLILSMRTCPESIARP